MNLLVIVSCLLVMSASAHAVADDVVQIPLKNSWALDMPGTIDIRSLEPNCFGDVLKGKSSAEQVRLQENSLLTKCLVALRKSNQQQPQPAFAVHRTGLEALKNARARLTKSEKPPKSLRPQDEVSVIFFSRLYGAHVHIEEVRQRDAHVEIKYRFVPRSCVLPARGVSESLHCEPRFHNANIAMVETAKTIWRCNYCRPHTTNLFLRSA